MEKEVSAIKYNSGIVLGKNEVNYTENQLIKGTKPIHLVCTLSSPKTLSVDWFEVNGTVVDYTLQYLGNSFESESFRFELLTYKGGSIKATKRYNYVYSVYLSSESEKVGTLQIGSKNHLFAPSEGCTFKYDNSVFYTFGLVGMNSIYELLADEIGFLISSVCRVDLAADGVDHYAAGIKEFYGNERVGKVSGKYKFLTGRVPKIQEFVNKSDGMPVIGYKLNPKKSDYLSATIYDKRLEILNSGKTYITDYLSAAGVTESYRYEISIGNKYFATLKSKKENSFELTDLFNIDKLKALFMTANSSFSIEYIGNDKNKARAKRRKEGLNLRFTETEPLRRFYLRPSDGVTANAVYNSISCLFKLVSDSNDLGEMYGAAKTISWQLNRYPSLNKRVAKNYAKSPFMNILADVHEPLAYLKIKELAM